MQCDRIKTQEILAEDPSADEDIRLRIDEIKGAARRSPATPPE
jgi:hypothetical protein